MFPQQTRQQWRGHQQQPPQYDSFLFQQGWQHQPYYTEQDYKNNEETPSAETSRTSCNGSEKFNSQALGSQNGWRRQPSQPSMSEQWHHMMQAMYQSNSFGNIRRKEDGTYQWDNCNYDSEERFYQQGGQFGQRNRSDEEPKI